MISDRIITFLPILVGVFCFTVFCIYRRRLNRMNPSQRQGKKAKMEAWLEDNAQFNLGYEYEHSSVVGGRSVSEVFSREHLFTQWKSMFHRVSGSDGTISIHVECGDTVTVKMGNVGRFEVNASFKITNYKSSRLTMF